MPRGVGGTSAANVMEHLKGLNFPASKNDLVSHAMSGPGPDTEEVVDMLKMLPDMQYHSPTEVMEEYGKVA